MKAASIIFAALLLVGAALGQWPPQNQCETGQCESGCETGGWGGSQPLPSRQPYQPRAIVAVHPSVCQVWVVGDPLPGTGVLIDKEGDDALVATVKHIADLSDKLVVRFSDNVDRRVTNIYTDQEGWDLAILVCSAPAAAVVPIAAEAPAIGATVTVHGWGSKRYLARSGRVKMYVRPQEREIGRGKMMRFPSTMPDDDLVVSVVGRDGDSGGPMIDQQGQLVAILSCTDQRTESAGACCRPLSRFLARVRARRCPPLPPAPPVVDVDVDIVLPVPVPWVDPNPDPDPTEEPATDCGELVQIVRKNTIQIDGLLVRIDRMEKTVSVPGEQGIQGPPGDDGQQGDQGLQGPPGEAIAFDELTDDQIKTLAGRISLHLSPIYFEKEDMATGTVVREPVYLGEGYRFRLFPPE